MLWTLEEVEEKSSSEMSDDAIDEKAISDYNQSFRKSSEISESATRLIKELQEMRRKKEEIESSQKRLSVSSRFQTKIVDEGQQGPASYQTRSKSSLAHDEDFAVMSIFAESAISNSSSSKTPGCSSAGTNRSGAQPIMRLFAEDSSSAYASSSATGTTNAHTLSGSFDHAPEPSTLIEMTK